jgi:hypothetical protein
LQKVLTLNLKSTCGVAKERRDLRGRETKLPEDIAPLALTWQRGTSVEVSWSVDSQDLPKWSKKR